VGSGSSGRQSPHSAKRSLICSTQRLPHPQYRGSGKKLRSDNHLNYQHRRNTLTAVPLQHITSRLMERNVVRTFLYPTFLDPPPSLAFSDQFVFHPNCSTSAAIISLLHTVINLLQFNPFVVVVSLDFSKAFDTISDTPPFTLLSKLAELDLTMPVYNWLQHGRLFQRPLAPYCV